MVRGFWVFSLVLVVSLGGFSSVSAKPPPVKLVSGVVSNVVSVLWKWLWSLTSPPTTTTKPAVSGRSMIKFESGYNVETLFDGSKLGIEPYAIQVSPDGDLLVLDSESSNIYRISMPLSKYSRPRLVSGSPEGQTGHVDGKLRGAKLNHPRGLTIDDQGNIYVADTMNMAIRKITDEGVTTIAGGKWVRGGGGHVDGPSEDAKFSDDFDLLYVRSSCSILVVDRGNQAIREIQLREDNCSEEDDKSLRLGIAVLVAAAFFGYMLALLQRRVQSLFSSRDVRRQAVKQTVPISQYDGSRAPVRPPLIPPEHEEAERSEEGLLGSMGRLVVNTGSSMAEIFGGLLSGSKPKKTPTIYLYQQNPNHQWPPQESFVVPREDEPPPLDASRALRTARNPHGAGLAEMYRPQHPELPHHSQAHHHWPPQQYRQLHQRHRSGEPKTFCDGGYESNEVLFGAVQEQEGLRREAVVIKAVDYGDYSHHNNHRHIRPRINYFGYPTVY